MAAGRVVAYGRSPTFHDPSAAPDFGAMRAHERDS
jgi:hypothetical protein